MLQGPRGSLSQKPTNSRSKRPTSTPQPHRSLEQSQQHQKTAPGPAAAAAGAPGRRKEHKRAAQNVSRLPDPQKAKRQARFVPRQAVSPVPPERASPPSQAVIDQSILRLAAAGDKGELQFQGQIRFACSTAEGNYWVSELLHVADSSAQPVLVGFDSETPVVWVQRGGKAVTKQDRVALLQLSYHLPSSGWPVCLLLQLSSLGFRRMRIVDLLQHPNIVKVGMGVAADMHELQKDYSDAAACKPQGLLDLDVLAHACGVYKPPPGAVLADEQDKQARGIKTFNRRDSWSLAGLLQHTTGYSLVKKKRVTQSNWAQQPLSQEQVEYAAADAFASLVCCMGLQVDWLRQRSPQLLQYQQLAEPLDPLDKQHPQQRQLMVTDPQQMGLWELSKGGSSKFRKTTSDAQLLWRGLLQRCCDTTSGRLAQIQSNARQKAEVLDPLDWQLGYFYDPMPARSGFQDTPF